MSQNHRPPTARRRGQAAARSAGPVLLILLLAGCGSAPPVVAPPPPPTAPVAATAGPPTTSSVPAPAPVAVVSPPGTGADPTPEELGEQSFSPTTAAPMDAFTPRVVRLEPAPGTVALTFDDGPDPTWTPVILDILRERGATATFFVLGWKVDAYPELARRIVAEGHSLQSHAYYHHNLTAKSDAYVASLIDDTARAIREATGTTPVCLRPPAGLTNARVERIAAERGHEVVLWTQGGDSGDYAHGSSSGVIRRAAGWQPGYVTLMHETWGFLYPTALPAILDDLEERGIGTSVICVEEPAGD